MDSPERAFDSRSQFLVDDSSSTASAVVVQPSAIAAAQAFLTHRSERSKTEEAAISAAREGHIPARSSREDGYMAIPKPGGTHRDWLAMIAYLVTEAGRLPSCSYRPRFAPTQEMGAMLPITVLCCAMLPKLVRARLRLETVLRLKAARPRLLGAPRRG